MEKINPISKEQLKFLKRDCKSIITAYMKQNNLSVHATAKKCGVQAGQLHMFLSGAGGLNINTVQRIADEICK
jgi:hypothetical protein